MHVCLSVRMLSLITTWLMLGTKLVKCTELPTMWKYQSKQKKKVRVLEAFGAAARYGCMSFSLIRAC